MVTRLELREVLLEYHYTEEQVDEILQGSIHTVLKHGKLEKIKDVLKVLGKAQIDVRGCLSILTFGKAIEIEKILEILGAKNIDVTLCLSILAYGKASEIEKILEILEAKNIDVTLCPSILAYGKASEMEKILEILEDKRINVTLCLGILAHGKATEIEKILEILETKNIDVTLCPSILAYGRAAKIKKILEILEAEHIDVIKCLSLLASGNAYEISRKIEILKAEKIDINQCLSILVQKSSRELKQMLTLLKNEKILFKSNLSFLTRRSYNDLKKVIDILKKHHISLDVLYDENLFSMVFCQRSAKEVMDLFSLVQKKQADALSDCDLRLLFRLEKRNNQYYDIKKIREFCDPIGLSVDRFIQVFAFNQNEYMQKRLEARKDIWIGEGYPITSQDLRKYGDTILSVVKISTIKFLRKNVSCYYLIDELEGFCLDIILNKSGALFYNLSDSLDLLRASLVNFCSKSLYGYNRQSSVSSKAVMSDYFREDWSFMKDSWQPSSFLEGLEMDQFEVQFLTRMHYLLQQGDLNYQQSLESFFHLSSDEYQERIEQIKKKIMKG